MSLFSPLLKFGIQLSSRKRKKVFNENLFDLPKNENLFNLQKKQISYKYMPMAQRDLLMVVT